MNTFLWVTLKELHLRRKLEDRTIFKYSHMLVQIILSDEGSQDECRQAYPEVQTLIDFLIELVHSQGRQKMPGATESFSLFLGTTEALTCSCNVDLASTRLLARFFSLF